MRTSRLSIFSIFLIFLVFLLGYYLGSKQSIASTIETPMALDGSGENFFRKKVVALLDSVQRFSGREDFALRIYTGGGHDIAVADFDAEYRERSISFNPKDFKKIEEATNRFAPLLITAHEYGHHFFKHDFELGNCDGLSDEQQASRSVEEYEADFYAGYILGLEGNAKISDLETVMRYVDKHYLFDDCYPSLEERLKALSEGFDKGHYVLAASPLRRTPQWDEMLAQYLEFNAHFTEKDSSLLITTGVKAESKNGIRSVEYDSFWRESSDFVVQAVNQLHIDSLRDIKPYLNAEKFLQPGLLKAVMAPVGLSNVFVFENRVLIYEEVGHKLYQKSDVIYKIDSIGIKPIGSLEKSNAFQYGFPYEMHIASYYAEDSITGLDSLNYLIDEDGVIWKKSTEAMTFPKPVGLMLELE